MPKNNVSIAIQIHDDRWDPLLKDFSVEDVIDKAIKAENCGNFEVSICFTNDPEIQSLNKDYRGKDKPTNVLSFPNEPLSAQEMERPVLLGDIIFSLDTIEKEAKNQEKPFEDHLSHLIIHGFLHLLGYDHMDDEEAQEMEAQEVKILYDLGIDNPYEAQESC